MYIKYLKFLDHCMYIGSVISPIESDANVRIVKIGTVTDTLMIIWKSDLSNKLKWWHFFDFKEIHEGKA